MLHKWRRAQIYGCAVWGLYGCGLQETEDLQRWIQTQKIAAMHTSTSADELVLWPKNPPNFEFVAGKDPFDKRTLTRKPNPSVEVIAVLEPHAPSGVKSTLEHYALDDITMVGSLQNKAATLALVNANQQIFLVRVGDYIGQNQARVLRIEADGIVVYEEAIAADGTRGLKTSRLSLQGGG